VRALQHFLAKSDAIFDLPGAKHLHMASQLIVKMKVMTNRADCCP
jgi:hypothetical protein